MKVLAIESSAAVAQVAVGTEGGLLARAEVPASLKHAAGLVPAIRDVLGRAGWAARELGLVCVSGGPGSYTGLRVGMSCAKAMAYATAADLVVVDTLESIAHNAPADVLAVEVLSDAQRQDVYAARWVRTAAGSPWSLDCPARVTSLAAWIAQARPDALVIGPALDRLRSAVPPHFRVGDRSLWDSRVETVLAIGLDRSAQGRRDNVWLAEPRYLRLSAAEEQRLRIPTKNQEER